jgi:prepilin-type N-terminal cleavage/methylation domain-containing protein
MSLMGYPKHINRNRRRGLTLTELIIAVAIATTTLVGATQLMHQATRRHHQVTQRQVVVEEASNVMEELMALPWDQLDASSPPEISLSATCLQAAPDAQLQIAIDVDDDANARRLTVQIHWTGETKSAAMPIRLVAWRYRL